MENPLIKESFDVDPVAIFSPRVKYQVGVVWCITVGATVVNHVGEHCLEDMCRVSRVAMSHIG